MWCCQEYEVPWTSGKADELELAKFWFILVPI